MLLPRVRRLVIAAVLALIVSAVTSPSSARADSECPALTVTVATPGQLAAALAAAQPGDVISLQDGVYDGNWAASVSGTAEDPIWLCGGPGAQLTNDGHQGSYALHLNGASYWRLNVVTGGLFANVSCTP
ncbi:hypothetical protein [Streptosporangium sp. V21-05]|uniref:hypothetical protein n=1 Tax=Streptosporangium sp. V21-05 TaxID=3446115 RepID=UPI003F52FC58